MVNTFPLTKTKQKFQDHHGTTNEKQVIHFLVCALREVECEKFHSGNSSKEMWDTRALAYRNTSQVKDSKISMLVHQYELFKMEDHGIIDKIQWRPQVITLRASKDLKKLPMEELLCMLKVHEIELNEDEGQRKRKFIALKSQKTQKGSSSKAFKVEKSLVIKP
ncbi:hypothetical protein CR513_03347, partial [Mucuna pruriens]